MKKLRRILKNIVGLSIFVYIFFIIYSWVASTSEIKSICSGISTGQSIAEVSLAVKYSHYAKVNLGKTQSSDGFLVIHSTANMGRQTCIVHYKDKKVVKVKNPYL
jgi:hypothetical protein